MSKLITNNRPGQGVSKVPSAAQMRRFQQQVTDPQEIAALLHKAEICRIALNAEKYADLAASADPAAPAPDPAAAPADPAAHGAPAAAPAPAAPYIVALNFGYDFDPQADGSLRLWFHSALEGRKLDLMRLNPAAGFQLDADTALCGLDGQTACDCGEDYASIVGAGILRLSTDPDERLYGLTRLMEHYNSSSLPFRPQTLERTAVLCLDVAWFTAKRKLH